jgi:hypothetical protein
MDRMNLSMIYLRYCKSFCKCHNVSPPSIAIKKKKPWKGLRNHSLEEETSVSPIIFPFHSKPRNEVGSSISRLGVSKRRGDRISFP